MSNFMMTLGFVALAEGGSFRVATTLFTYLQHSSNLNDPHGLTLLSRAVSV